jgi:hypothetical protein
LGEAKCLGEVHSAETPVETKWHGWH